MRRAFETGRLPRITAPRASSAFGTSASSPDCRAKRLETIRIALAAPKPAATPAPAAAAPFDGYPCPTCRTGRLRIIGHRAPHRRDRG